MRAATNKSSPLMGEDSGGGGKHGLPPDTPGLEAAEGGVDQGLGPVAHGRPGALVVVDRAEGQVALHVGEDDGAAQPVMAEGLGVRPIGTQPGLFLKKPIAMRNGRS